MRDIKKIAGFAAALAIAATTLTGCAAPAATVPAQTTQAVPGRGLFTQGTIAALRPVDMNSSPGSRTGANDVLAALQQPPLNSSVSGQEVVILTNNNTAATLSSPQAGLEPGDKVVVTGTGDTTVIRRY